MNKEKIKWLLTFLLFAVLAFGLDRFTKALVLTNLKGHAPFVLIPGVFELTYFENTGIAWSMLDGQTAFITVTGILLTLLVLYFVWRAPTDKKFHIVYILTGLFIGGALGNMYDRLSLGYVVDFLYFSLIHFPVFNIADSFIVVSVILCGIIFLFVYNDEDLEFLNPFPQKKKQDK